MSFVDTMLAMLDQVETFKYRKFAQFLQSDYLYCQELMEFLLWERDLWKVPKNRFIDYSQGLRYHEDEMYRVQLNNGGEERTLQLPYKEIVNFITNPGARIWVAGDIAPFTMRDELRQLTDPHLRAFRRQKKKTFDGPLLRVSSLRERDGQYECNVEHTSYFWQARTNLSLDYQFPAARAMELGLIDDQFDQSSRRTLRMLDTRSDLRLRPFDTSILVNTIGVAGVVYFRRSEENYFFMDLRRGDIGVFERMFGSVSGAAEHIHGMLVPELVSYAQWEVINEFEKETGLENSARFIRRITPLAFTRELTRGGKPQFFFLIEIPDLERSKFREKFMKSATGLEEFTKNLLAKKTSFSQSMSPELCMNLAYALQFLQHEKAIPISPLVLSF